MYSARWGHYECLHDLIKFGADLNLSNIVSYKINFSIKLDLISLQLEWRMCC